MSRSFTAEPTGTKGSRSFGARLRDPSFFRVQAARVCIALVVLWNVQCALAFLVAPAPFAAGFELAGAAGESAVRGIGLLFLMWNVPYAVALWRPVRHRMSLYEAVAMQTIGLFGESLLWLTLPPALVAARSSIARFIAFDAAGLALLLLAVGVIRRVRSE